MEVAILDIVLVGAFIVLVAYIGFRSSRNSDVDYVLAGRKLTLPLFVTSLIATWYGAVLGAGEFVYTMGVFEWTLWGLPYYAVAILYALFIAPRVREPDIATVPDKLEKSYGRTAGLLGAFAVLGISIPAPYVLSLGLVLDVIFGTGLTIATIAAAGISLVYVFWGGLRSSVVTDMVQAVAMYVGFAILLIGAWVHYGSPSSMFVLLPESHTSFTGNGQWQLIIAWSLIAFQTFVDPSFHQRCCALNEQFSARKGLFFAVGGWFLFDALLITCGLYAVAFLPGISPTNTYFDLAHVLGPGFVGLFLIGVVAAIMSTLDSLGFIGAVTIGRDIIGRLRYSVQNTERTIRASLILIAIASVVLALYVPSVVNLLYLTSSIVVPGLLIPVLLTYVGNTHWRLLSTSVVLNLAVAPCMGLSVILAQHEVAVFAAVIPTFVIQFEPMIVGIAASVVICGSGLRRCGHSQTY